MELRRERDEILRSCNKNQKSFLSTSVPAPVLNSLFDVILWDALVFSTVDVKQQKVRTMEWLLEVWQWSWAVMWTQPVRRTWPQPPLHILSPRLINLITRPLKTPMFQFTNLDEGTPKAADTWQMSVVGKGGSTSNNLVELLNTSFSISYFLSVNWNSKISFMMFMMRTEQNSIPSAKITRDSKMKVYLTFYF